MAKQNIAALVDTLVRPTVEGLGYALWDVEYVREGADWHLIITIDTEDAGGITIDDCEKVHRAIDPIIDEADPIETSYSLEVSSPGIERVLSKDAHIAWAVGQKVEVKLFTAIGGSKRHVGILRSFDGGELILDCPDEVKIPRSAVSKMKNIFFD